MIPQDEPRLGNFQATLKTGRFNDVVDLRLQRRRCRRWRWRWRQAGGLGERVAWPFYHARITNYKAEVAIERPRESARHRNNLMAI